MELEVFDRQGASTGRTVALDAAVFDADPNDHVLWLDVRRTQAAARQGTHKTRERGEVIGSSRKLYRQKGTGMARAGNVTSPLRRGGGRAFGPRPRAYGLRLGKKVRRLARRSALTYKARSGAVRVVEALGMEQPSTADLKRLLAALDVNGRRVLIVTAESERNVYLSGRNLDRTVVREARNASSEDILRGGVLVCEEEAISVFSSLLSHSEVAL